MISRDDIINEARSWIGTSFKHQGRLKKTEHTMGGCDCLGLLIGVARALNLRTKNAVLLHTLDDTAYGRAPLLVHKLSHALAKHFSNISLERAVAGDILLINMDHRPYHVGILSELNNTKSVIHACAQSGHVAERIMDGYLLQKIHTAFDILSGLSVTENTYGP